MIASMGGGFLFVPLLLPAHVWAASRSGRVGRFGWSLLPAASLGMVTWALVYVLLGEAQPTIWLLPTLVSIAALAGVAHLAAHGPGPLRAIRA